MNTVDTENLAIPGIGWNLVLLRRLAADIRALAGEVADVLDPFRPDRLSGATAIVIRRTNLDDVSERLGTINDLADIGAVVGGGLWRQATTLTISAERIAEEAAVALRNERGDSTAVRLSAMLLNGRQGFPALADAICAEPAVVAQWGALTVRELLASFRGVDPAQVRRVCAASGVHPDATWSRLDPGCLARIASQLRGAA